MKIAVVILNWNGAGLLREFLPSVIEFSAGATVYVADNASADDSVELLESEFPSVTIIRNTQNFGFAKGYNESLKHIEADVFALVNSDIAVTPGWLSPIRETFETEPQTAIIQPKIRDFKNKEYFEYAGAAGGFIDRYGYPFCRGRIFDTIEKDEGQYNDSRDIFWASGACFFIRSSVYNKLHGFDAGFFAHQEEIDLCWRAINAGHIVRYVPQSVVYHVGGATLSAANPRKTFLNFRNSLAMLVKNLPVRALFPVLLMRLLLDGVAGLQFLAKGKFAHFFAVIRAHFAFYGLLPRLSKRRGAFQVKRYYTVKSIVWLYYLRKKKTFSRLF